MFTNDANLFSSIMVKDMCGGKKKRFKDCCAQKHDRLCGASLLVRMGSPMIVLWTCTPFLKKI